MGKFRCNLISIVVAILIFTSLIFAQSKYPLTVTDQFDRNIVIPKEPQRIVSGAPNNTEILFALGLGKKLVGVTNYCLYPSEARRIAKVGDITPLNIEKIVSLRPDLVVANVLNGSETVNRLSDLGIPVITMNPDNFGKILMSIELIGKATGRGPAAVALNTRLRNILNQVQKKAAAIRKRHLKVFVMLGVEPYWTAGPGSFLDEAVRLAGAQNIAADIPKPWAEFSTETLIIRNPDVILTDTDARNVYANPNFTQLDAVKKHQVFAIDSAIYYRPGPELIEKLNDLTALLEKCR